MSTITLCQLLLYVNYHSMSTHSMSTITLCQLSLYVNYHSMSTVTLCQISTINYHRNYEVMHDTIKLFLGNAEMVVDCRNA